MQHIFLDLEFSQENDIISIGAVKSDHTNLIIDRYYQVVRPMRSYKLDERIVKLTKITDDDVKRGLYLHQTIKAMQQFGVFKYSVFSFGNDGVILSTRALNLAPIEVQEKYADLAVNALNISSILALGFNQDKKSRLSLTDLATLSGVSYDEEKLHNALYDAELLYAVTKKIMVNS